MLDISTVGLVSVPMRSALETCRRELSEDVWFGIGTIGTFLVVEQSSLENRPLWIYTVLYGRVGVGSRVGVSWVSVGIV